MGGVGRRTGLMYANYNVNMRMRGYSGGDGDAPQ